MVESKMQVTLPTGMSNRYLDISDGRCVFWQYDTSQRLVAYGFSAGDEVHFDMPNTTEPLTFLIYERNGRMVCDVPDELLQTAGEFTVWACVKDDDGERTVYSRKFRVKSREKPTDYISTPLESFKNFEEEEF